MSCHNHTEERSILEVVSSKYNIIQVNHGYLYHVDAATISCGHPGNITNGKVILDNGTKLIGSIIYYKCDEGYRLNGPPYRTCGQYGWIGREPSCGEIFDEP